MISIASRFSMAAVLMSVMLSAGACTTAQETEATVRSADRPIEQCHRALKLDVTIEQ